MYSVIITMVIQKSTPILTRVGYRIQRRDKHVHKSRKVKTDNNLLAIYMWGTIILH